MVRSTLKRKLISHIQKVSPIHLAAERTGEISTVLIQGVDRLDAYFRKYLPQLFISVLLPVMVLLVVFPFDWISGVVLMVTAPLIPLFMVLIGKQAEKETQKQWKLLRVLGGHFLDVLQGLTTLKLFGLSKAQGKIIRNVSDQYAEFTLKVLRITFLSALVLELLSTISIAVIAVQIGVRLLFGQMSFLYALFILILAPDYYLPLRQLGSAYHSGMQGIQAAERIFEILALPVMETDKVPSHKPIFLEIKAGDIKFIDVDYSYPSGAKSSLRGVDFYIPPRTLTTLVGVNGSGKSTILFLLLKFIGPDRGVIEVSGKNLKNIDDLYWRKNISWVPQFPYLFNDSIEANLLIANPAASRKELVWASKKAHLHDFVSSLSEGYDTVIGEGASRLSSGQAQRLAIARAILKDAPFLIMDEPTKNLDFETEEVLRDSVEQLRQDRTVLVVAHRFSVTRSSDQIFVLDQGRIVQTGNHAQLIQNHGHYRNLFLGEELKDENHC